MTDSILIVGGGVAGLTAAMTCAGAGARAIVVERDAIAGGRLAAAMTDDSSVGDSLDGVPVPKFSALEAEENIEIITLADLEDLQGRPGNFTATIRQRARFVTDTCTRCNRCRAVCPSVSSNEYDAGLTYRKAIFTPLPQTLPGEYVIDIDSCLNTPPNYLPCNRCVEVCDDDSIHFDLPLGVLHERQVGAVIVAAGVAVADSARLKSCGYGAHPDVVTAAELQRLMISPGPTGGFVAKPSNEEYPGSILLILDELTPFSVYTAASQMRQLGDQDIGRISLLVTVQPTEGRKAELLQALPAGADVRWGLLREVGPGSDGGITVSYADFASNRTPEEAYDMVVLQPDFAPAEGMDRLAGSAGFELDEAGYVDRPGSAEPFATTRPGVYVAGGAGGPVSLPETAEQARSAAVAALAQLDPRLLQPGHAPAAGPEAPDAGDAASNAEFRDRIERALYALLRRGE